MNKNFDPCDDRRAVREQLAADVARGSLDDFGDPETDVAVLPHRMSGEKKSQKGRKMKSSWIVRTASKCGAVHVSERRVYFTG